MEDLHEVSRDILPEKAALYFLRKHLLRLGTGTNLVATDKLNTANRRLQHCGVNKTQKLLGFISMLEMYGEDFSRMVSSSTFDRRKNDLISVGAPLRF